MQKFLYIIRNHGNSMDEKNRSILGVFTSPQKAAKALRKQLDQCKRVGVEIYPEVKVVKPNLSGYCGCSAYSANELLADPSGFQEKIAKWWGWNSCVFKEEQL